MGGHVIAHVQYVIRHSPKKRENGSMPLVRMGITHMQPLIAHLVGTKFVGIAQYDALTIPVVREFLRVRLVGT